MTTVNLIVEYNIPLKLTIEDKTKYAQHSIPIRHILNIFNGSKSIIPSVFSSDYKVILACVMGASYNHEGRFYKLESEAIRQQIAKSMGWYEDIDTTTKYGEDRDNLWNPSNIYENAKMFIKYVKLRHDILINNQVKLEAVTRILRLSFPTTICFNESTVLADTINEVVNREFEGAPSICYYATIKSKELTDINGVPYCYTGGRHAGKPRKFGATALKALAIQGMNNGHFRLLCTAKAFDKELEVPFIEQVITTAGLTKPTRYKQRKLSGQLVDIYNPERITKIFNLYFDDFSYIINEQEVRVKSRDKANLEARQENTSNIIWLNSIEEIDEIIAK